MVKQIMTRGSGKTTSMVFRSASTHQPILCSDKANAEYIKMVAKQHGVEIPNPIPVCMLKGTRELGPVLVDEVDHVLEMLLRLDYGGTITGLTISPVD